MCTLIFMHNREMARLTYRLLNSALYATRVTADITFHCPRDSLCTIRLPVRHYNLILGVHNSFDAVYTN